MIYQQCSLLLGLVHMTKLPLVKLSVHVLLGLQSCALSDRQVRCFRLAGRHRWRQQLMSLSKLKKQLILVGTLPHIAPLWQRLAYVNQLKVSIADEEPLFLQLLPSLLTDRGLIL